MTATTIDQLAKQSKAKREAAYADIWIAALEAGSEKAAATRPEPMTVIERANPLDDSSPITKSYGPYADGLCGFAWITLTPGTTSFARWAARNAGFRKAYYGGLEKWAPNLGEYGQSYGLKLAWATGAAEKLREYGINATPGGRLD